MKQGKFIVIDGPDGCGKTTQIKLLAGYLAKKRKRIVRLREPGSTKISEQIRKVLLNPKNKKMSVKTELLLYMASRAQLVDEIIKPALKGGRIVICDRFLSSTIVYQGLAGGMGQKIVEAIGHWAIDKTQPDLTIILDIKPRDGLGRIKKKFDRMEAKAISFHCRVQQGFLKLARQNQRRFRIIKAYGTRAEIQQKIRKVVDGLL